MVSAATAAERPVNMVIVYNMSRFARLLHTHVTEEQRLNNAGVKLVSVTEHFGEGANAHFMGNMVAIINEKYARDASLFTRRDRRKNAQNGFWNGGNIPFGYVARTVQRDGTKERKRLFIDDHEASIVRRIYELARVGLNGQPMGTRSISEWLANNGYNRRGRPFHHSALAGILSHPHYRGTYPDKTADDNGDAPQPEHYIWVPCPRIINPDEADEVAAIRAKAAPSKTPPRITNSRILLSSMAVCGVSGCGRGLTIRTGKGGRYSYYTCSAKALGTAARCACKPIREEELDDIVMQQILTRILEPARLQKLLHHLLEASDDADERRTRDLQHARAERTRSDSAITKLLELIETGLMSATEPLFASRLSEHRTRIASLNATIESLERQLQRGKRKITPETINKFGKMLSDKLNDADPSLRKAYVKMIVSQVSLSNDMIVISGSKLAMEHALVHEDKYPRTSVPTFDREWCRLQDSNL
jgi:site-specific DNA recombinase